MRIHPPYFEAWKYMLINLVLHLFKASCPYVILDHREITCLIIVIVCYNNCRKLNMLNYVNIKVINNVAKWYRTLNEKQPKWKLPYFKLLFLKSIYKKCGKVCRGYLWKKLLERTLQSRFSVVTHFSSDFEYYRILHKLEKLFRNNNIHLLFCEA